MSRARTAAPLLLASLAACMGSEATGPELLHAEPIQRPALLSGGGPTGLVAYHASGRLHVLWIDPGTGALAERGTLEVPLPGSLGVGAGQVALLDGWSVRVVDAGSAPLQATDVSLTPRPYRTCTAPAALVDGRWLLATTGGTLELVDLAAPATRAVVDVQTGCVTRLVAVPGGFLAFTTGGWVKVHPALLPSPFAETGSTALGTVRAAFARGTSLLLAGEAVFGTRTFLARAEYQATGAPLLSARIELDGRFGALAWDGVGTSVVQLLEGDGGGGRRYGAGWLVREVGTGFRATPVPLPGWAGTGCNALGGCDEVPAEHLAALPGLLVALQGPPYALGIHSLP